MQTELSNQSETCRSPGPLSFYNGFQAGFPIAIGYIPAAIAFGLLSKSAGVPNYITVLMSLIVFAGASQFMGARLVAVGTNPWEIVLATFMLNLRHFLMSASVAQRIQSRTAKRWMALLAFGVTDETFTVACLREEQKLPPKFILGLNLISYSAWNAGTWAGVFVASSLPESVKSSMGIALYAMFIGLLVPALRKSHPVLIVALVAVGVHSIIRWVPCFQGLSAGWSVILTTVMAAGTGAAVFPKGVVDCE